MSNLTTRSGKKVYPIGIGTWGVGGTWEKQEGNELESIKNINYAISLGLNHIDSGQIYGGGYTDEILGKVITNSNREDLFLANKVWETHVGKNMVEKAVQSMLAKLNTKYLDMLYIHKPWEDFPWREAIPQINSLIDKKVVRYFAVSNFNLTQLKEANKLSKHSIAANQIYFNAISKSELTDDLYSYCAKNNIQIIAYRPLERTLLLKNNTVKKIAKKHNSSSAQVALAWILNRQVWPIPGISSPQHSNENIKSLNIKLSKKEVEEINSL